MAARNRPAPADRPHPVACHRYRRYRRIFLVGEEDVILAVLHDPQPTSIRELPRRGISSDQLASALSRAATAGLLARSPLGCQCEVSGDS